MAFDINLYRLEKARRIAAGTPKYTDLSPTGPTPEDDARVGEERGAAFFHPQEAVTEPVVAEPVVAEPVVAEPEPPAEASNEV